MSENRTPRNTRFSVVLTHDLADQVDHQIDELRANAPNGGQWSRNHLINRAIEHWLKGPGRQLVDAAKADRP